MKWHSVSLVVVALLLAACGGGSEEWTPVIKDVDGIEMVLVPAGEFQMGSSVDSREEKPTHSVYLDAFWIDRTEVTYGQFAAFLNDLGGHKGMCAGHDCNETKDVDRQSHMLVENERYVVEAGFENYPMAEMSWYGAEAYCNWAGKRLMPVTRRIVLVAHIAPIRTGARMRSASEMGRTATRAQVCFTPTANTFGAISPQNTSTVVVNTIAAT